MSTALSSFTVRGPCGNSRLHGADLHAELLYLSFEKQRHEKGPEEADGQAGVLARTPSNMLMKVSAPLTCFSWFLTHITSPVSPQG